MAQTLTGTFDNLDKVANAYDELVSKGIPRENLQVVESTCELRIALPDTESTEALEILRRHGPVTIA
ncbi:MAG: hypothetical protein R3298_04995 [Gammaproteobacteria bacterium]|nr:hypothetical protein [Gammaproteobacteria bacterium]